MFGVGIGLICELSGSHGCEYEDDNLMGYYAVYSQSSLYEDSHYEISLKRTFVMKRIPSIGSSSKRELAHPRSSEQNRTRANEIGNKGRSVAQPVNETG
jgi:hypothetical protein